MVTILVVEDNIDLRELIAIRLRRVGYSVLEADNGREALNLLDHNAVHLIVLDVMMPIMDGYELTETLRDAECHIPIIIVTARETLEDKRIGFQKGADDYMVKPIDIDELLLRIEALLRRANIAESKLMRIGDNGDCEISEEALAITFRGETIELRQKEFHLLHKLLSYPGRIFTRHALMDEIWGYDNESDPRTVDVHIKRLREKIAAIPYFEIQTVRGLGYKAVLLSGHQSGDNGGGTS